MKLTNQQAYDLTYCPSIPEVPGVEVEANEYIGSGRWESYHKLVLRDEEGRFWAATYSQGLTERQDTRPFEYDGNEIEFRQVEKVPVTTYEYRDIKPEGGTREPAGDSPDSPAPGEAGLPGEGAKPGAVDYDPDDPADLWPNILRVEPDEFIKASS